MDLRSAFGGKETMTAETPPDWVLLEAAKRCGWSEYVRALRLNYASDDAFRALCDMIAKHEKKPVDRKVLCAREALKEWEAMGYEGEECMIGVRAIELYEEGFEK
jgi:hypothetical protein